MGEWKAQISLRVRQALRAELEEFATRERRKLGNLGELLVEWAYEQLKEAGCTCSRRESALCQRENERMDKSKVPINLSVREVVWLGPKHIAEGEREKTNEITALILEWSVVQLRTVGSINRLLKCKI